MSTQTIFSARPSVTLDPPMLLSKTMTTYTFPLIRSSRMRLGEGHICCGVVKSQTDAFVSRDGDGEWSCGGAKYVRGLGGPGGETLTSPWPCEMRIWALSEESVWKVRCLSLFTRFSLNIQGSLTNCVWPWRRHSRTWVEVEAFNVAHFPSLNWLVCTSKWRHFCRKVHS